MRALLFSNLFPTSADPNRGLFTRQLAVEIARLCDLEVVVPLPWFPGWAQQALWWTPCPALLQGPIDVFTERVDPLPVLGHQLLCAVLLLLVVRVVLARGARRLVVHGG